MTLNGLSRRQILTIAGLTIGVAVVEVGIPASAASAAPDDVPPPELTLQAVADEPVAVLSGDATPPVACPRQLAVRVINDRLVLPTGTKLTVTFDPRLFALVEPAVVTLGSRLVAAASSTARDRKTGLSTYLVTLREAIPARSATVGDLVVVLGTVHPLRYPYDLTRHPASTVADLAATARSPRARRELRPDRPPAFGGPVTPWGVEIGGGWSRHAWGADDQFWYHCPTRVSIRGVGPSRTPPAAFTVAVDPRLIRDITVDSARLNDKPFPLGKVRPAGVTRTDTLHWARWRTAVPLDTGDVLDVSLRVVTASPAGALASVKHPVVASAIKGDTAQRRTGLVSVTRTDSHWA